MDEAIIEGDNHEEPEEPEVVAVPVVNRVAEIDANAYMRNIFEAFGAMDPGDGLAEDGVNRNIPILTYRYRPGHNARKLEDEIQAADLAAAVHFCVRWGFRKPHYEFAPQNFSQQMDVDIVGNSLVPAVNPVIKICTDPRILETANFSGAWLTEEHQADSVFTAAVLLFPLLEHARVN